MYDGALVPQYWFVLGGRGTGLSTLASRLPAKAPIHLPGRDESSIGVYDPGRTTPLAEISRTVLSMLRFDTRICRDYAPGYSPKIFLTEEQFFALREPLGFVPVDRVWRLQGADAHSIADVLYGTHEPPHGRLVRASCDSRGRPIWAVLKALEPYLHSPHALSAARVGDACAAWVKEQTDLWPLVAALAGPSATTQLGNLYTRINRHLPIKGQPGEFVERAALAGVWRYGNSKTVVWSPVWHAGAQRLANTISLDALKLAMQDAIL